MVPRSLRTTWCPVGTINPQALDSANELESRMYMDPSQVYPHSTDGVAATQADSISIAAGGGEQNVHFVDSNPGFTHEVDNTSDPLRDAPLATDATLEEFFKRPVKIFSTDWAVGANLTAAHTTFDPWNLYFSNKRVVNRLNNYRLLRSKLHVKFTISGNSFHYGRVLVAYNPLAIYDGLTAKRNYHETDFVGASQRPHIFLDPNESMGGEMILPFFYHKNLLDITVSDFAELGTLDMNSMTVLKHANGASDGVTINVFAWAEDIKFALPTQANCDSIVPQGLEIFPHSDEYGVSPVSRVAGVVASAATRLSSLPYIGRFARATEIGASALGAVATLFGFSAPIAFKVTDVKPVIKSNLAVCNMPDDIFKLTVDAKQELSIDPMIAGLDSTDELGINYIASKETYLTSFDWPVTGTGTETMLFSTIVDPGLHRMKGDEIHLTAPAYAMLPFKYWRGSLKFRFQVVCSGFHKGRFKVVYDPVSAFDFTEYNTAYTTIVDISDTKDFTVTVGWGQEFTYREALQVTGVDQAGKYFGTLPTLLPMSMSSHDYGNGWLSVYCVNELTVPNTTVNNDITINVFISAGDDFEVAQPDSTVMQSIRLSNLDTVTSPQGLEIFPHAEEESAPYHTDELRVVANVSNLCDNTNLVHFGENIRSFRQLCKRYNSHMILPLDGLTGSDGNFLMTFHRPSLPTEGGYSINTTPYAFTPPLFFNPNGYSYNYEMMTMQKYTTLAFAGWRGSMRWLYDCSHLSAQPNNLIPTAHIGLSNEPSLYSDFNHYGMNNASGIGASTVMAQILHRKQKVCGHDGTAMISPLINPILGAEIPYYSNMRFTPAKQRSTFDPYGTEFNMPHYTVQLTAQIDDNGYGHLESKVAAGEDFTCFFYLGPPVFYYEASVPG